MPRKGKGVRRILREERRFREKKKQGKKNIPIIIENHDLNSQRIIEEE